MKRIILSLAVLSLAACSGSSDGGSEGKRGAIPGSDLPALTADQKTRVVTLSREGNDIQTIVTSKDVTNVDLPEDSLREGEEIKELSENGKKFKKTLKGAIDFGRCHGLVTPDINDPTKFNPEEPSYEFRITHANASQDCPIYFLDAISTTSSKEGSSDTMDVSKVTTKSDMEFIVDPLKEVRHELDIKEYKFGMTTEVTTASDIPPEGTQPTQFTSAVGVTSQGKGTIVSKTEGTIDLNINMTSNTRILFKLDSINSESFTPVEGSENNVSPGLSMNVDLGLTLSMTFEDGLQVVGYQTGNITVVDGETVAQEEKYYLNGVETDKVEFSNTFSMESSSIDSVLKELPN